MLANSPKTWLLFIAGLLISMFLVWFGLRLLFSNFDASPTELFLMGVAAIVAGVYLLPDKFPHASSLGLCLLLVGIYYFARAAGVFERGWLVHLLGLASLAGAVILIYITLPWPHKDIK